MGDYPIHQAVVPVPPMTEITGSAATANGDIWIVPQAREHLASLVKPWHTCFEWGAGGSTIWFGKRCSHTITVEVHPRWYIWTANRIAKEELGSKVRLWYTHCTSADCDLYADTIEAYDEQFDIISADGFYPARRRCIELGIQHLKPGGVLVIDNTEINMHYDFVQGMESHAYRTEPFEFLGRRMTWETILYVKP